MTGDHALRAITLDGAFRVVAICATDTARAIVAAQKASARRAVLLAEMLTGTVLVRETMSPDLRVQGILQGDDPKTGGSALYVTDKALFAWSATAQAPRRYGVLPVDLQGWHHVAVVADGKETRAFLDGKLIGSIAEIVATDLRSIGNHWEKAHQNWMMCAGLDDQFIFRRPLTAEEIQKVMAFEKPAAPK